MERFTIVSFHAHPDDEALLTAGTLARAAAQGNRVVLAVATDGERGLTSTALAASGPLAARRRDELDLAAAAIGAARVVHLGYPDSGWRDSALDSPDVFSRLDPSVAAGPLVELLREERADVLTTYDPAGGYGHPDHVAVHRVGGVAARAAGTPSVLEATVDRALVDRAVRVAGLVPGLLDGVDRQAFAAAFSPRSQITHRVDVRAHLAAKRAAMAAHVSQAGVDQGIRTLRLLLALPGWLFALAVGHEWFTDRSARPGRCDDVFAGVRADGDRTGLDETEPHQTGPDQSAGWVD